MRLDATHFEGAPNGSNEWEPAGMAAPPLSEAGCHEPAATRESTAGAIKRAAPVGAPAS